MARGLLPSSRVPACVLAAVFCLLTAPAAQAQVRIRDMRVGFPHGQGEVQTRADRYKVGTWAPVVVEVENVGEPFYGTMVVETTDGDGVWTRYALDSPDRPTPVVLDPEQERRRIFVGYIKIGSSAGDIKVTVAGRRGKGEARAEYTYQPYQHTTGLSPSATVLLCLGQPKGFENIQPQDYTTNRPWFVAFQPDVRRLPEFWFGYEGVDVVILPSADTNFLQALMNDEVRRNALAQWVQMGGHLVVSVSSNHALVANRQSFPLEPLLPAEVGRDTVQVDRLHGVEAMVREKTQEELLPFATRSSQTPGAGQGRRNPVELARLTPRHTSRIRASEPNPRVPEIVQGPYGLGRVTLLAFDTDQGPFTFWDSREHFWPALLDLKSGTNAQAPGGYQNPWGYGQEQDLAARLCNYLEQFGEVPVIPFGWVAAFIFVYILIVGPLDYFFLKKVVKRMEWTWVTFPTVVLLVSLGAYWLANYLKGNELRINKIDLLDVDLHTQQVYGSSWFTIFSPQLQHYDIDVRPVGISARPEGINLSWMGRPDSGMRGLRRGPSAGLFTRSYDYERDAEALKGVPISVWSVKTLTTRWQSPTDRNAPPFRYRLERAPNGLKGSITSQLTSEMRSCYLIFDRRVWTLETLAPQRTVEVPSPNISLKEFLTGGRQDWTQGTELVRQMMFYQATAASAGNNEYLDYLDQTGRMDFSEAILIGVIEQADGSAADVNAGAAGCRLEPFTPRLSGTMKQSTIVRAFFPVARPGGEE